MRRTALIAEARDEVPVARVGDLPGIVPTLRGKVEFEVSEEGREEEILVHLLRRAIAETFRARLGGADLSGLLAKFEDGGTIESGELVSGTELLRRTGEVPGLAKIMARLGMEGQGVVRRGRGGGRVRPRGPVPDPPSFQGQQRWNLHLPVIKNKSSHPERTRGSTGAAHVQLPVRAVRRRAGPAGAAV